MRLPRYCFCWPGRGRWPLADDDRHCGLCGRRTGGVWPLDAPYVPGLIPHVVAYLDSAGQPPGWLGGSLRFEAAGIEGRQPRVEWLVPKSCPVQIVSHHCAEDTLVVELRAPARTPAAGSLGQGRLAIAFGRDCFELEIDTFAVANLRGQTWLALSRDDPPCGNRLVVYRGAAKKIRLYLHFELGDDVLAQWEAIECDHPAAAVEMLDREQLMRRLTAVVRWDVSRLRYEDARNTATFRLKVLGFPWIEYATSIDWRLELPLRCQPAGLVLPSVAEDRPEVHLVQVTNIDPQPVQIKNIETTKPWVAGHRPSPALLLPPGHSAMVSLEIHPQHLNGAETPHTAKVAFHLAGRGRQFYPVRIESVRRLRRLEGPLLLDPGPPRVVLARTEGDKVIFLRCSGDTGLDPTELGVAAEDYARAVHAAVEPGNVLTQLVTAARVQARIRDHLEVHSVMVCGQPWLPADAAAGAGVAWRNWTSVCSARGLLAAEPGNGHSVLRFDTWSIFLLRPNGTLHSQLPFGFVEMPGWCVLTCLAAGCGVSATEMAELSARFHEELDSPRSPGPDSSLSLLLACEQLLADYSWGAGNAWRRLLPTWRRLFPRTRGANLDLQQVDRALRDAIQQRILGTFRQVDMWPPARQGTSCVLLSPLFRGNAIAEGIESAARTVDLCVSCVAPNWAEWLTATEACSDSA